MTTIVDAKDACPRCGGVEMNEIESGPDSYDDDISYMAYQCVRCGLWRGWRDAWFVGVSAWQDEEEAEEYDPSNPTHNTFVTLDDLTAT